MESKYVVQITTVVTLGVIGVTAVALAGIAYLYGQAEPTALVAVGSAIPAYLAGLLTTSNGHKNGKPNGS